MSIQNKSPAIQKIDRKWVRESKRTFLEYPGWPRTGVLGEEETWLELAQFYRDDLKWLLSLEHHKFWSHMIYSEKAHKMLVSFLKESPPNCLKRNLLVREDMRNVFEEIERLVFLAFLRLSTERESESCYIRNFRDVIYINYLFTVPIILDICLIYGTSNRELVKKMINNVVTSAPDFLDDFQEIIPHFINVLKTVKEKFPVQNVLVFERKADMKLNEVEDVVLYLCDAVATIELFLELYPSSCQLFNRSELITEIAHFYSVFLPEMVRYWSEKFPHMDKSSSLFCELIQDVRIDMLKIVKSILDFVLNESEEILEKREETINEYLNLIMILLSEPVFFHDYNLMYSVEYEMECAIRNCQNVDLGKVDQILRGVASTQNDNEGSLAENSKCEEVDVTEIKFDSLVTEVKDIFPHLEDTFIRQCLKYYNNNTERVIAAVLENSIPSSFSEKEEKNPEPERMLEFTGKHKNKHKNLNEMLNDREEISKLKDRYAELSFVVDETYDDEYDDTYDDNIDISVRDGDEAWRRPFVVPRVLRGGEEMAEEETEGEDNVGEDEFVENAGMSGEQAEPKRSWQNRNDVVGRGRGQGQSKQVLRNRGFKESHKSSIANHNRKRQAGRKMARGMIPS